MFDSSFIKAENFGYDSDLMHDAMIRLGKLRTSEPISRDRSAVQAVRSLDDLIETCNLMNERLHEWYGLHFPELADYAQDRRYAELIARFGERDAIIEELGIEIGSIGSELEDEDMRSIMDLADQLCMIYDSRERTEEYISEIISSSCPNMCALIGGPLTARLIGEIGIPAFLHRTAPRCREGHVQTSQVRKEASKARNHLSAPRGPPCPILAARKHRQSACM